MAGTIDKDQLLKLWEASDIIDDLHLNAGDDDTTNLFQTSKPPDVPPAVASPPASTKVLTKPKGRVKQPKYTFENREKSSQPMVKALDLNLPPEITKHINTQMTGIMDVSNVTNFESLMRVVDNSTLATPQISIVESIKTHDYSTFAALGEYTAAHILAQGHNELALASVIAEVYKLKYMVSENVVYEFENHGWTVSHITSFKAYVLRNIFQFLGGLIKSFMLTINAVHGSLHAIYDRNLWQLALDNATIIYEKLQGPHMFLDSAIQLARTLLSNPSFETVRDSKHLVRYMDGIYDFEINELRPGRTDDYCIRLMSVPYSIQVEQLELDILMKHLRKIFPDQSILDFVLDFTASCLEPRNRDKILCIFRGCGNGGKTFICSLLEKFFGDYCVRISTATLSGKRPPGGAATPDLAILGGNLLAITQEPAENERLNFGLIKELTGNENSIYIRRLYKEPQQISIKCKIIVSMNLVTIATGLDKASENRLRVVPFAAQFVSDPEDVDEARHIYLADPDLENIIPNLLPALMVELRHRYYNYKQHGLHIPDTIKKATTNFIAENEPLFQYLDKFAVVPVGTLHMSVLWDGYKSWHTETFPGAKLCSIKRFCEVLNRRGIKTSGEGINGFVYGLVRK